MTDLKGRKPILCLDFDGVCHSYTSGWKGAEVIPDPPVSGLFEFLTEAAEVFELNVFSSRSGQDGGLEAMREWFVQQYLRWANNCKGPCRHLYNSLVECGYGEGQCMHNGSPSPIVPKAGRHDYVPSEAPETVLVEQEARDVIAELLKFPTEKPPAFVGLDDRVLNFAGVWPNIRTLENFKPWNAKAV